MYENEINKQELYQEFIAKNKAYDGFYYACVKTTNIFCKFTCPARKPLFENVEFVKTIYEAKKLGFRECQRCRPNEEGNYSSLTNNLIKLLDEQPQIKWTADKLKEFGIDNNNARRAFQKDFGKTFLEFAREYRLGTVIAKIQCGEKIIDAQLDAGFSSPSGFHEAIKRHIGIIPSSIENDNILCAKWVQTPIGAMLCIVNDDGLHLLEFFDRKGLPTELEKLRKKTGFICFKDHDYFKQIENQLREYFNGERKNFSIKCAQFGTKFEKEVWLELQNIPYGEVKSYSLQAIAINNPKAVRAVARANGSNKIAIIIPCHRVIGSDGSMTGYGGKIWRKEWLLKHEKKFNL